MKIMIFHNHGLPTKAEENVNADTIVIENNVGYSRRGDCYIFFPEQYLPQIGKQNIPNSRLGQHKNGIWTLCVDDPVGYVLPYVKQVYEVIDSDVVYYG